MEDDARLIILPAETGELVVVRNCFEELKAKVGK